MINHITTFLSERCAGKSSRNRFRGSVSVGIKLADKLLENKCSYVNTLLIDNKQYSSEGRGNCIRVMKKAAASNVYRQLLLTLILLFCYHELYCIFIINHL